MESENLEDVPSSLLSVHPCNGRNGRRQELINQIKRNEEEIKKLEEKYIDGEIGSNKFRETKWHLEDEVNTLKIELQKLEGDEK